MKKVITFALMVAVLLGACTSTVTNETTIIKTHDEIGKAYFLLGSWENTSEEGTLTEAWVKQNDSVYSGRSYFIAGKDTSFSESINLEQKGNQLFYIPNVKNQNGGQSVEFKLSASSPTQLVFENPQHDFPSKITYTLITKDSMLAEISGNMNGNANTQQFPMKRVK